MVIVDGHGCDGVERRKRGTWKKTGGGEKKKEEEEEQKRKEMGEEEEDGEREAREQTKKIDQFFFIFGWKPLDLTDRV